MSLGRLPGGAYPHGHRACSGERNRYKFSSTIPHASTRTANDSRPLVRHKGAIFYILNHLYIPLTIYKRRRSSGAPIGTLLPTMGLRGAVNLPANRHFQPSRRGLGGAPRMPFAWPGSPAPPRALLGAFPPADD
ncbi:hypothetical protein XU18_1455 [Perkinsela sp. CCAP 1560/4]|nr:hypothetical protein XU18_1455 [Perkinsela sp. CCAP 1560/4]|eukprot:KNH07976.1 hypothetical protein XU18_1455 [Perkinsela sp. CCAP 1560/4]